MTKIDYDKLDPIDYNMIDLGVQKLVRLLRTNGFDTCDSGDGVSKQPEHRFFEHPHVFINTEPETIAGECDRLHALLASVGVLVPPAGPDETPTPEIGGSYDPAGRLALIHLYHVTDDMIGQV